MPLFLVALSVLTSCARLSSGRFIRGSHLESTDETLDLVAREMWAGRDVAEALRGLFIRAILGEEDSSIMDEEDSSVTGTVEKGVQVLGLQNTGTNLLFSMLMINFGSRLAFYDAKYQEDSPSRRFRPGVWKHANLQVLHDNNVSALDFATRDDVVAIMMVRDPMSWLQSMTKAPYELEPCVTGDDWITKRCLHPIPAGYDQARPQYFANLEGIWNKWTRAYDDHDQHGFPQGIVVRYEDLVIEPEATMDMIAKKLGMKKPSGGWDIMTESSKDHGDSHGRMEAVDRITSRSFMEEYAASQVKDACLRLDAWRMAKHLYETC